MAKRPAKPSGPLPPFDALPMPPPQRGRPSAAVLLDDAAREALIAEGAERGNLEIEGGRIKYVCRREFSIDYTDPEERVRAAVYAWLILEKDYPANQIDLEVPVPRRTPSDWADIVVYSDLQCRKGLLRLS